MVPEQGSFQFEEEQIESLYDKDLYKNLFAIAQNVYATNSPGAISGTIGTGSGAIGSSGIWSNVAVGANGPAGYGGGSGAGGYYSVNGNVSYPSISLTDSTWYTNGKHALDVKGDANFEGDLRVKGKSIIESLDKIEQRLALLTPNIELEDKWDELKELGEKYRQLEREILEKQKVWNILKK